MKKKRVFNIVSIIFTIMCLFFLSLLSCFIFKIDVIPTKYLLIGYAFFILIIMVLLFGMFGKTKKFTKILAWVIMTILSFSFGFATYYLNSTYQFLSNTKSEYDTLVYSVITLKNSSYSDIESLESKTVSYLDDDYKSEVKKKLTSKITYKENIVSEFGKLPDLLIDEEVDAIVLEESYLTLAYEEVEDFEESIKVIYTFEVKVKAHVESSDVTLENESFILYISGIDQYGNVSSVRGRSDVNILSIVNPKTHHILLVNTPRDYYVQLAGTTGLKDKLTHAGIYGIDKSIATLEKLYNIDIDHYLRVNFNTVIKVVDVIGGIDVYSDKTFKSFHIKGWTVPKGWNHFNGKQALAYSRERYAYIDGDHHRGRNQQDVITAIIDKVSTSSILISKYNSILNALDGSFQTDMDMNLITSFIRYQLDEMPTWEVESIAVTGYNSMNYTYSMSGGKKLYVMEPDYNSVAKAKKRVYEVLNEE